MRWRLLKLNWSYGIGELVIVVVGVLIALGVDGLNSARLDRDLEDEYLGRLSAELEAHSERLDFVVGAFQSKIAGLVEVYEVLDLPEGEESIDELIEALTSDALNMGWALPELSSATFEELISVGRLSLIRNVDLRSMLLFYYAQKDELISRVDARRSRLPQRVSELLRPNIFDSSSTNISISLDDTSRQQLVVALTSTEFKQLLNAEGNFAAFALGVVRYFQGINKQLREAVTEELVD